MISSIVQNHTDRAISIDPELKPYASFIYRRIERVFQLESQLTQNQISLTDFASGHEYYGLHFKNNEWVIREWAPNAQAIYLIGNMTHWQEDKNFLLTRINSEGVWELRLPSSAMYHHDLYRLRIHWKHGSGDRIPAYTRRVVQDLKTLIFNAQVWHPTSLYYWKHSKPTANISKPLLIYEAHIGMAQQAGKIGSYQEFTQHILGRIAKSGYNTIQLMAIQEHPYYASFGYQVSNFFAASSRFGTPDELKELIDTAHGMGLRVIMDIVHSHAVSNVVEGLARFDGSPFQYFHDGTRGEHEAWGSRCFNYAKYQVIHFLLSNCRFWLDEYQFDGFRFDGVTSMLYVHHGLNKTFTCYDDYFNDLVDEDAYAYLTLANKLVHTLQPDAITIAEEVSGMPLLATSIDYGGAGFDYRFAMNVPDYWIQLTKDTPDEFWHMGHLWFELTHRRQEEKTISYAESHDQAMVGDQTLILRLAGAALYNSMHVSCNDIRIDRAMSLHKMIRLITIASAGSGYLNFMGNEFGHPDWIDFPREGNGWSFEYARRQWNLLDDPYLKNQYLANFDREMIAMVKDFYLLDCPELTKLFEENNDKVLAFVRCGLVFVFNFHPSISHVDYIINTKPQKYRILLHTDEKRFGGYERIDTRVDYFSISNGPASESNGLLKLYLPSRTAIVFVPCE
ncbi:MAG: alpha amylase C-terminal domain-containing protein [Desulfobacterales bacterium]|nr:alpha amylase C-terminal domain-containing protein [Desulfobacterales bacterium]